MVKEKRVQNDEKNKACFKESVILFEPIYLKFRGGGICVDCFTDLKKCIRV